MFLEYPTDITREKGVALTTAWSNADHPIVAASFANGEVDFFLEEGERIDEDDEQAPPSSVQRAGCKTHCMEWSPRVPILASGWDDGMVCTWTEKEGQLRECGSRLHKVAVTLVCWSPDGSRLITGDSSGKIGVWQSDQRGRLMLVCQYARSGAIKYCVFRAGITIPGELQGCPPFFIGGDSGIVYFADDDSHCSEVIKIGAPINSMYYSHSKEYLVIISVDVVLYKYKISPQGKMHQERKVKLSVKGDGSDLKCVWAGADLLAACNGEKNVRLWHLERDDNYVLHLHDPRHMADDKDVVRSLTFNPRKQTLAAGTQKGRVVMWKYIGHKEGTMADGKEIDPSALDWDVLPPCEIKGAVQHIRWGPGDGSLSVSSSKGLSIFLTTLLNCKTVRGNSAIQMSAQELFVSNDSIQMSRQLPASIRIKGVDVSDQYTIVWNGKKAEVRDIADDNCHIVSQFATKASNAALYKENVFLTTDTKLEICNMQGVVKKVLGFLDEGTPNHMDLKNNWLAVSTDTNILKVWDVTRREPKQIVPGRQFTEIADRVIKGIRINSTGTKVSMLVNTVDTAGLQVPDTVLYVYDVELDRLFSHEFGPSFYPVNHTWDVADDKLLAVESRKVDQPGEGIDGELEEQLDQTVPEIEDENEGDEGDDSEAEKAKQARMIKDSEITTLFATSDHGVKMQDSFPISSMQYALMGLEVPHLVFCSLPKDSGEAEASAPEITRRPLRDFVGLVDIDEQTKNDLLNFSYHLTIGNMDEAYRAVKKISSTSIWENMAQMCVKTKRLDVAEVCFGNMENARGARAVRLAKKEPQVEARVAMVAIQLGQHSDAERLYRECGRYDLLRQMYEQSGDWRKAIRVCSKHDRIHLKTSHYMFAKHLEALGDTLGAIRNFEKSDTHKSEVPRMLFQVELIDDLKKYIDSSDDKELFAWWGQYCESEGNFEEAIQYYRQSGDNFPLVRNLCHMENFEEAEDVCLDSNDLAACYHLARMYDRREEYKKAINFFTKSKRLNHGIRIARENNMESELMGLALASNKRLKLEAAKYFEERGSLDRAVELYHRGGRTGHALQLCFEGELFDALRGISENLEEGTDPAIVEKCATFFLQHNQFDKAAALFVSAKKYKQALELCLEHNIALSEEMTEKLTPPKSKDPGEKQYRVDVLNKLAAIARDQGNFYLACKKYTQAGDKLRAMKCLLKSNDAEKIIYYATMTKKKEIYILAANFLQNLDWHSNEQTLKTIIKFYTSAKALDQLSSFFDSASQVEIDEFRDYEKALIRLKEAVKYMIKAKAVTGKEERLESLDARIRLVTRFVEARGLVKRNPQEMVDICTSLLDSPDVDTAIRVGDVFALLVEYYYSVQNYQEAYNVIQRMRASKIILNPYLDQAMVQKIHSSVGETAPEYEGGDGGGGGDEVDDDIDEDFEEEEVDSD